MPAEPHESAVRRAVGEPRAVAPVSQPLDRRERCELQSAQEKWRVLGPGHTITILRRLVRWVYNYGFAPPAEAPTSLLSVFTVLYSRRGFISSTVEL